jgi:hypothetical protein
MIKRSTGIILGFCAYAWATTSAGAVVVDIDVRTEGEPVPGATISFETQEGEEIPPIELTELTEEPEPSSKSETPEPAVSGQPQGEQAEEASVPQAGVEPGAVEGPREGFRVQLPDTILGKDMVVLVHKDDKLIKRETVTVDKDSSAIAIEAYDPADAELDFDLSQPKTCRRGDECDYQIAITNKGDGIYVGPLFLIGQLYGTVVEAADKNEWWCRYAGGGRQICLTYASLEPGGSQNWTVSARLPKRVSQNASNCLEISTLGEAPRGRSEPLVQAIQAGLATKGIDAGRPDGVMGPTTQAAVAQFVQKEGLEASTNQNGVFDALFGLSPERLARLGLSKAKDCEKLALMSEPRTVSKEPKGKPSVSKQPGPKHTVTESQKKERRKRALGTAIGVGIGIGAGIATHKGGGHERHPHHD